MHPEALQYIEKSLITFPGSPHVLEIGSRDVGGGSPRTSKAASWTGIDMFPGENVDVVGDGATWGVESIYDIVVCAEVFEHAPNWKDIIKNAHRVLKDDGIFVGTAAGEGRIPHSAINGAHLTHLLNDQYVNDFGSIEYYGNIMMQELLECLHASGFQRVDIQIWKPGDIYWTGVKL